MYSCEPVSYWELFCCCIFSPFIAPCVVCYLGCESIRYQKQMRDSIENQTNNPNTENIIQQNQQI